MEIDVQKTVDDMNSNKTSNQECMHTDLITSEDVQISQQEETENPIISEDEDLRQFDVLDDLERHTNQDGSDSEGCSNDSIDSDIPDDEIEAMLEEGLPDEFKGKRSDKRNDMLYEEKEKLVLDEIGHNHFDVLPEGWVQVMHNIMFCQIIKFNIIIDIYLIFIIS
jgi:hypothetical protein